MLSELEVPGKPRSEINRLNRLFHVEIVRASANALSIEMHERTQYQYWKPRLPVVFLKEQLDDTTRQHRGILDALKARNGAQAEQRTQRGAAIEAKAWHVEPVAESEAARTWRVVRRA